jgi:hypothetical protein
LTVDGSTSLYAALNNLLPDQILSFIACYCQYIVLLGGVIAINLAYCGVVVAIYLYLLKFIAAAL